MNKNNNITEAPRPNVIDDLGFSEEGAAIVKLKIDLLSALLAIVKSRGYSPRQLEKILDQPQPRISELMRGKISKMSVERLAGYLHRLGSKVEFQVEQRPLSVKERKRLVA